MKKSLIYIYRIVSYVLVMFIILLWSCNEQGVAKVENSGIQEKMLVASLKNIASDIINALK